jgi:hypothetical protein
MTTGLKELLTEYAVEARPYAVGARALASGRRRRAVRRTAPVVAVVLLLVIGAIAAGSRLVRDESVGTPSLPSPTSLSGFPAAIAPRPDAPTRPTDRAVGRGVLVYQAPERLGGRLAWFLVTVDGSHYRLDAAALPTPSSTYQLSADRRWLISVTPDGPPGTTRLWDLTAADRDGHAFTGGPIVSADGRWLALRSPGMARIVDLRAGIDRPATPVDLSAFPDMALVDVRPDGDLVLASSAPGTVLDLSIVERSTGVEKRRVRVDLTPHLTPAEQRGQAQIDELNALAGAPKPLIFAADGLVYFQTTGQYSTPDGRERYLDKDVLVIDLVAGRVRQRLALPEPVLRTGEPDQTERWVLVDVRPEGLILQHRTTQRALAWELFRPATGQRYLLTDLTGLPGK